MVFQRVSYDSIHFASSRMDGCSAHRGMIGGSGNLVRRHPGLRRPHADMAQCEKLSRRMLSAFQIRASSDASLV